MERITFEDIPAVLGEILEKINGIELLLKNEPDSSIAENEIMNIHQASAFLKIPVATIYTEVSNSDINVEFSTD
ncbi:hypothetical protein QWY86_16040 [Pedobacter aquatilis]|uniref:hypothetical protein n=1 Tax=Pedobacter aquatilis TaxID=351343 RepID=UPI0025B52BCC|nr:hypothetical protein [Pedobacter aquatilis]MDN3588195.1 hypothetical protein [Pedobacter aquatilis]